MNVTRIAAEYAGNFRRGQHELFRIEFQNKISVLLVKRNRKKSAVRIYGIARVSAVPRKIRRLRSHCLNGFIMLRIGYHDAKQLVVFYDLYAESAVFDVEILTLISTENDGYFAVRVCVGEIESDQESVQIDRIIVIITRSPAAAERQFPDSSV